jgi:hypothetical protein
MKDGSSHERYTDFSADGTSKQFDNEKMRFKSDSSSNYIDSASNENSNSDAGMSY